MPDINDYSASAGEELRSVKKFSVKSSSTSRRAHANELSLIWEAGHASKSITDFTTVQYAYSTMRNRVFPPFSRNQHNLQLAWQGKLMQVKTFNVTIIRLFSGKLMDNFTMFFTSQNKMAEKIIPNLAISQKYKASRSLDINDYSALTGKDGKISRGILSQIRQTRAHAKDSQMRVGGQKALRGVVLGFLQRRQQWLGRSINNRTRSMDKLASLNARLINVSKHWNVTE